MIGLLAMATVISGTPDREMHLNQRQLDAISDRCGTPHQWLQTRHHEIHVQPDPTAKYEKVVCLISKLRLHHAGPMGFVGNEATGPL
jgi:hypothetical protein